MLFSKNLSTPSPLRQRLRDSYRCDEGSLLTQLLAIADIGSTGRSRAWERARELVIKIRSEQVGKGGVDALLNEFALSTEEGVVLMCLAEALLRVPDSLTIDRLIRDKLSRGNWSSHLGNSDSLFVNASAWGLLLTGKVVNYNDEENRKQIGLLQKTMGRMGEPVIRASVRYAMQVMGTQFVMGTTIGAALERARGVELRGYRYSYDMLGEGARTMADADRYFDSYMNAIEGIGIAAAGRGAVDSPGISVKLSAIHPRYEFSQRKIVLCDIVARLKTLALAAKKYDIGFTVDAEEADRLDISLDVIEAVFSDSDLDGWEGFGIAVQAYQKRGLLVIEWVRELTLRVGRKMMLRLVKGAYWDTEIKLAQVEGFSDFPVFTRKASTDVSYQACARKLLEYRDSIYPQFATHNAYTVATILEMDGGGGAYEFQRLHGMGEALYDQVLATEKVPCRVYAPVGVHADLLAYLVRRLLENGANSSFVNNIVDESIPVESLLDDPVERAQSWTDVVNPGIVRPAELFGLERVNAAGTDLSDMAVLQPMRHNMLNWLKTLPLDYVTQGDTVTIRNPALLSEKVGVVSLATSNAIELALSRTDAAFGQWSTTTVTVRAALLQKLADVIELKRDELIALCCKEAGKVIADGVAEVREAVDFCRYYAASALRPNFAIKSLQSRGVILCISPWNFPLAIFLGQVAAALAAGNTVIAKPAEQTCLIALRCLELMREVGFPGGVMELLIAEGPVIGEKVVPDLRIKAVMFTGSTETGAWIARRLARRSDAPIPLVAETGGQNCMLVDSTALPEQVVDDVITSGFQSAGQRCSALRVLFLQDEIADKIIAMIIGAMTELHIGDPSKLSTDIGPVIDAKAKQRLQDHVTEMKSSARLLYRCEVSGDDNNYFFAPHLFEISNLSLLKREVFGPIVHIIRYRASALDQVIEQINATGYGLTFGIHSRIEQMSSAIAGRIKAGNIYINRNMIGAAVGVQPFGGCGLSGTGPKAGGPHYLERLVTTPQESQEAAHQQPLPDVSSSSIAKQLQASATAWPLWAATSLNNRLSALRQFIAKYAQTSHDDSLDHTLDSARLQLRYAAQLLHGPTQLPGPTGELNQLFLEPRGNLMTIVDAPEHHGENLMAIISALAAGNCVTAMVCPALLSRWQDIAVIARQAGLSCEVFSLTALTGAAQALASQGIHGVMVHAGSRYLQAVTRGLAERDGAILPLISCVAPHTLLRQTLSEKTVSIDTTAAGGNASLMTMAV